MSELSLPVLWAILSELLGIWLPILVAAAAAFAVFILFGLRAAWGRVPCRFWAGAALIGVAAGVAVAAMAPWLTQSSLHEVQGPADWLALGAIACAVGLAGAALLVSLLAFTRRA